uniref:Uncharacterized protein n=1 Tax=Anopheles melas TaxID=34690 RepID=A0A182U5Z6_9DIPT
MNVTKTPSKTNAYFLLTSSPDADPSAVVARDEGPPMSMIDTMARSLRSSSSSGWRCRCARSCFTLPQDESSLSSTFWGLLPTATAAALSSTRASSRSRLIQRDQTSRWETVPPSPPPPLSSRSLLVLSVASSPLLTAASPSNPSSVAKCSICAIRVSIVSSRNLHRGTKLSNWSVLSSVSNSGINSPACAYFTATSVASTVHQIVQRAVCSPSAFWMRLALAHGQQPQHALRVHARQYALDQILHRILFHLGHRRCRYGRHLTRAAAAAHIVLLVRTAAGQLFLCQQALLVALFSHLLLGLDRQLVRHVLQAQQQPVKVLHVQQNLSRAALIVHRVGAAGSTATPSGTAARSAGATAALGDGTIHHHILVDDLARCNHAATLQLSERILELHQLVAAGLWES